MGAWRYNLYDGNKEWFRRTIRQNLSDISNYTYKKLRQQEDLTWYSKRNTRSGFGFVTWHVLCNKILRDKLTWYQQLAFEIWERRPRYTVTVIPAIIGALGGSAKKTINELTKLLTRQELVVKTADEMQKTILMVSDTVIQKNVFRTCRKWDRSE